MLGLRRLIVSKACVRPDTLIRLVASAQATSFDSRPIAAVIAGSEDDSDSFGRAELAIRPLLDAGFMVRFSQVAQDHMRVKSNQAGLLERLQWAAFASADGTPGKALQYVLLILHGEQRDGILGPLTPARGERARRLDLSDERRLLQGRARALLAPGARGALISCWTGEGVTAEKGSDSSTANLAQLLRRVWPQAAKEGFIAPRIPAQIEPLDLRRNSMWDANTETRQ